MICIISRLAPSEENGEESLDAAMMRNMSAVERMNRHIRISAPAKSMEPAMARNTR